MNRAFHEVVERHSRLAPAEDILRNESVSLRRDQLFITWSPQSSPTLDFHVPRLVRIDTGLGRSESKRRSVNRVAAHRWTRIAAPSIVQNLAVESRVRQQPLIPKSSVEFLSHFQVFGRPLRGSHTQKGYILFDDVTGCLRKFESQRSLDRVVALKELREILFRRAQATTEEDVEDLEDAIGKIVANFGHSAIDALEVILADGGFPPTAISDLLREVGDIRDVNTVERRRILLEAYLKSSSPTLRYGALFGLLRLGSVRSKRQIFEALNNERVEGLRRDMEKILRRLESSVNVDLRSNG